MNHVEIFVRSLENYFDESGAGQVEVGTPFVLNQQSVYLDMTGSISISGKYIGAVYASVSQDMIETLTGHVLATAAFSSADAVDMMGEFTNTVVGNVRDQLGPGFDLSVPMVIQGKILEVNLPRLKQPIFVIPFTWRRTQAYLMVGLERIV